MTKLDVIEYLGLLRKEHQGWLYFYQKYPEALNGDFAKITSGLPEHHKKCVDNYTEAIELLRGEK